jgi:hypothetical protein
MSYAITAPEMIASAATDLASIGLTLNATRAGAAAPTTGVLVAAEDEVSAAIAELFSGHGKAFHALSAQAAAFHEQFVQTLTAGARAYAGAEVANASRLGQLLAATNAGTNGALVAPSVIDTAEGVALIIGGSGEPIPSSDFVETNFNLFVKPLFPNVTPQALFTPEGNYGLYTGVKSLTLDVSESSRCHDSR